MLAQTVDVSLRNHAAIAQYGQTSESELRLKPFDFQWWDMMSAFLPSIAEKSSGCPPECLRRTSTTWITPDRSSTGSRTQGTLPLLLQLQPLLLGMGKAIGDTAEILMQRDQFLAVTVVDFGVRHHGFELGLLCRECREHPLGVPKIVAERC